MQKLHLSVLLIIFLVKVSYAQIDAVGNTTAIGLGATSTDPNYKFTYQTHSIAHYGLGWYSDADFSDGPMAYLGGYGGIKLFTQFVPRLTITANGQVGIGLTNPGVTLTARSNINAWPATSGSTQSAAAFRVEGGDNAVMDFGANSVNTWIQATDKVSLNYNYNLNLNPNGGKVGIGTAGPPSAILQIHNNVGYLDNANNQLVLSNSGYRNSETGTLNPDNAGMAFYFTNYTSGVKQYDRTLDIRVRGASDGTFGAGMIRFFANDYTAGSAEREIMRIHGNGNVGIGTPDPQGYRLAVNGTIHSKAVVVDLIGWPDYVFEKNYGLLSLPEVKIYIDNNHHLPGMPSATEIEKEGLDLGEMNKLLTKKVEELTLYLVEKDKQLKEITQKQQEQNKVNQKLLEQLVIIQTQLKHQK